MLFICVYRSEGMKAGSRAGCKYRANMFKPDADPCTTEQWTPHAWAHEAEPVYFEHDRVRWLIYNKWPVINQDVLLIRVQFQWDGKTCLTFTFNPVRFKSFRFHLKSNYRFDLTWISLIESGPFEFDSIDRIHFNLFLMYLIRFNWSDSL